MILEGHQILLLVVLGTVHIPVIASMRRIFLSTEFGRYLLMFTVLHSKGHPRRFSLLPWCPFFLRILNVIYLGFDDLSAVMHERWSRGSETSAQRSLGAGRRPVLLG